MKGQQMCGSSVNMSWCDGSGICFRLTLRFGPISGKKVVQSAAVALYAAMVSRKRHGWPGDRTDGSRESWRQPV